MNLYQPTITGSLSVSGSVNISGSITIAGGGTISGTASIATTALTASSADNLLVRNILTAQTLVVQTITSSVDFVTGSTRFGSIAANTHVFTGSMSVSGSIISDQTDGGVILIKTTGSSVGLLANTFQISGSGTKSDLNAYVYGGESFGVWTNGTKRLTINGAGAATFLSSVTATNQTLTKSSDGIFATFGGNTPKLNLYQFSSGNVINYGHNFYYNGSSYGLDDNTKMGWEIRTHVGNANLEISSIAAGTTTRTTRFFIDGTNGNIGIGTNDVQGQLDVYKSNSGGLGGYIMLRNNGAAVANETAVMFVDGGADSLRGAISCTTEGSPYFGAIKFKTGAGTYASLTTRMTVTGGGLVGIGTTDIDAQLKVFSNDAVNLMLATTTKTAVNIVAQKQGVGYATLFIDTEKTHFFSSGNEKMRLDTNGVLKIGNGVNPDDARNPGYANVSIAYNTSENAGFIQAIQQQINVYPLRLNASGGAVYAGGVRLDTLSDERMKKEITPLEDTLGIINQLKPKKFYLIDEKNGKLRYGFIAQELEGLLDNFVYESDMNYKDEESDYEVKNIKGIENWASSWAALLVKGMQEQQTQIQELKAEFDAYKITHP